VVITTDGWSISTDGAALSILSVTGSGTSIPRFVLSREVLYSEILSLAYNSTIGETKDLNDNDLATIVSQPIDNDITGIEEITVIDNVGLAVAAGTNIQKTATTAGWLYGCASDQQINSGIGWIEFNLKVIDAANYQGILGLSHVNLDADYDTVEFGMFLYTNGVIQRIESGSTNTISGFTYVDGDKLRVYVDDTATPGSGEVTFWKWNGAVWELEYTFTNKITMPCMFDCSLNIDGSSNSNQITIENIKIAGSDLI